MFEDCGMGDNSIVRTTHSMSLCM